MFPAASQLVPLAVKSCRQIIPPVVATLIAAGLISAYNRAFSSHVQQPRMSALHETAAAADGTTAPITTVGMTRPPVLPAPPATETITIYEEVAAPERLAEKDAGEEAGKDQSAVRLAAEPRVEPHRVASAELPVPPVVRAPVPVIVAVPPPVVAPPAGAPVVLAMPAPVQQPAYQPPPVIAGAAPMVTVPDRLDARPVEEAGAQPPPPARGPIGKFVHAMKPSTWFAAAREFGQKIEDTGNEILPNIRQ